jgi:hypothetical protein
MSSFSQTAVKLSVRLLRSANELKLISREWDELFQHSPDTTLPSSIPTGCFAG